MDVMPGARVERTPAGKTLVWEIPQSRCFSRLTRKGREASEAAWSDPLQALCDYPRHIRSHRKPYARHGNLPSSTRARCRHRTKVKKER